MSTLDPQRILAHLQQQQPHMVRLLEQLASAESPSEDRGTFGLVQEILDAELRRSGMTIRRVRGRQFGDVLVARPAARRRHESLQLLVGHCDTVWPVGTVRTMPVQVDEGLAKGPGVFDMKGGLVQMIHALRAVAELGLRPPATTVAVINADEELGSPESSRTIRRLARRAARAFVLEPAFGRIGKLKTARKGVGSFEIVIKGRASHAGIAPEEGVSAILELSHQIQRLFALNDASRGVTVNVGTIDGGLRANVVAPEVRASVDVRVPSRQDALSIEAAIRGLRPQDPRTVIDVTGGFDHPPMEPGPRNQALWRLARDLGHDLGLELEQASVGGASDGNTTSLLTATLDGLGSVGDGAHAAHEFVEIARMAERSALLVLLLMAPLAAPRTTEMAAGVTP